MQTKKILAIALLTLITGAAQNITLAQTSPAQTQNMQLSTQAYLGIKQDFIKKDGYCTGGKFISTDSIVVPADHFAHDALFQFEGPGWESGMVGYRLYLDNRNRTDIFGKKTSGLVLDKVGLNDLVSDGKESYQQMADWGQDIFKVGNSLGIGSVAAFNDSVITVSDYDSVLCHVINKPDQSTVKTTHYGWKAGKEKTNISISYSIQPGSRLTYVAANAENVKGNMCTGLAKHDGTEFFKGENNNGWCYIAVWGKQTIINDNLGIALIYKKDRTVQLTEDKLSFIVVLSPVDNKISYYFTAAWEQENNGIKTRDEFKSWLDKEIEKINEPVQFE